MFAPYLRGDTIPPECVSHSQHYSLGILMSMKGGGSTVMEAGELFPQLYSSPACIRGFKQLMLLTQHRAKSCSLQSRDTLKRPLLMDVLTVFTSCRDIIMTIKKGIQITLQTTLSLSIQILIQKSCGVCHKLY